MDFGPINHHLTKKERQPKMTPPAVSESAPAQVTQAKEVPAVASLLEQQAAHEADSVTDLVAQYASAIQEEPVKTEVVPEPVPVAENTAVEKEAEPVAAEPEPVSVEEKKEPVVQKEEEKVEEKVAEPKKEPEPEHEEAPVSTPAHTEPSSPAKYAQPPASVAHSPSLSNIREFSNRFSTAYRPASPASTLSRRSSMMPVARTAADGAPIPTSAVTGAVRATNPILDELLYSIKLLGENDPSLTSLDLKDCTVFSMAHGSALAEALAENTNLKELNLCNAQVATATASELAIALRNNKTLEILNLESNAIAPMGIKHLAEALAHNSTLTELRLINQKQAAGIDAEQTFATSLQKNQKLTKLGLQFRDAASRNAVDRAIMRNKDIARKARLAQAQAQK
ncbi:hypothetical protein HDU79_008183 [Rhizoclosmatium sp. JEL0117]|nr:hypothetical protein HDU79_008183 [Rhizoclosmatium sp. JEL0117]